MPFADAARVLAELRRGERDPTDLPSRVLVVDVDDTDVDDITEAAHGSAAPPPSAPVVVVGVTTKRSAPSFSGLPDILVADCAAVDPPWVPAPDGLPAELARIEGAVAANPDAAATLMQVLRTTGGATTEQALVVESLAYATLQAGAEHRTWLNITARPRPDNDRSRVVALEREGGVLRIWLDRPARRNAYSARVRDELVEALSLPLADPSVTSIEIRARGPNFCSGGDLAEFGTVPDSVIAHRVRMARSVGALIHLLASRVEVYVHGACVGAGVELPAFAGRVIAEPDATFALPEVQMGLIPGAGGTASIPRRIGRHRAGWLALTGKPIDAGVALDWGLVDEVAD